MFYQSDDIFGIVESQEFKNKTNSTAETHNRLKYCIEIFKKTSSLSKKTILELPTQLQHHKLSPEEYPQYIVELFLSLQILSHNTMIYLTVLKEIEVFYIKLLAIIDLLNSSFDKELEPENRMTQEVATEYNFPDNFFSFSTLNKCVYLVHTLHTVTNNLTDLLKKTATSQEFISLNKENYSFAKINDTDFISILEPAYQLQSSLKENLSLDICHFLYTAIHTSQYLCNSCLNSQILEERKEKIQEYLASFSQKLQLTTPQDASSSNTSPLSKNNSTVKQQHISFLPDSCLRRVKNSTWL